MDKSLKAIRGIDKAIIARLAEQEIYTVMDLHQNTLTPAARESLASSIKVNAKSLYVWSKQADLMRVDDIDEVASEILVKSGIRNVVDLATANTQILFQLIDVITKNDNIAYKKAILATDLQTWQKTASIMEPHLVNNSDDKAPDVLFTAMIPESRSASVKLDYATLAARLSGSDATTENMTVTKLFAMKDALRFPALEGPKTKEGGFFFGLSEMMIEIGRGVAKAQHELDMSSIEIQKYIDAHEDLRNYGLSATWYAMPDTSFQMKVDYTVVLEDTEEGTRSTSSSVPARLRIAPLNAKYQNYFKRSTSMESELNLKIVPVPPPTRFTESVFVPDLIGLTLADARQLISDARLLVGELISINESTSNGQKTQVVSQSKEPGTETVANDAIGIAFMGVE